jgi:hypothetical protein
VRPGVAVSISTASGGVYKSSEWCGVQELAIMVSTSSGSGGGGGGGIGGECKSWL